MKRMLQMVIVLSALLTVPALVFAHTYEEAFVQPLIAGGGNVKSQYIAGSVNVWNDAKFIYVEYTTTSDWCLTETHLEIAIKLESIPQTKGGPIPGKFTYKQNHKCADSYTYKITNKWSMGTPLFIAAHAVVKNLTGYSSDLAGFEYSLPSTVEVKAVYYGNLLTNPRNYPAYFEMTVFGGVLGGVYDGWCADTARSITSGQTYTAKVYSSYETIPAGAVDKPWNFDLVNWIINQDFVGKVSPACPADAGNQKKYTFADVQRAIWVLIDDMPATGGIGNEGIYWTQCRVDEILSGAYEFGNGFVPGCFQRIVVVFVIDGVQTTIIDVPVPCKPAYGEETAWGGNVEFPGKNWAKYFIYEVQ